jgi:hypothetical protein
MTRILALGQNKSHTIMVLNLAPVKSYHLDTMSSLNFANRTKKIETNEIENQPFFRDAPGKSKLDGAAAPARGPAMNRQPLRPKILSHNSHLKDVVTGVTKPAKTFSVFSDKPSSRPAPLANTSLSRTLKPSIKSPKRPNSDSTSSLARPSKFARTAAPAKAEAGMSQSAIEALIERKVTEALAQQVDSTSVTNAEPLSEEVQKRLDALEKRVGGQENERAEGLQFLLMAKQHQARGENASALRMYQLAMPHFPGNEKLMRKVVALQDRMRAKEAAAAAVVAEEEEDTPVVREALPTTKQLTRPATRPIRKFVPADDEDLSYHEIQQPHAATHSDSEEEEEFTYRPRTTIRRTKTSRPAAPLATAAAAAVDSEEDELAAAASNPNSVEFQTPRTKHLLAIINSRDVSQIKLLKGVGAKRAEAIANCLCDLEVGGGAGGEDGGVLVESLGQLGRIKGVGGRLVENMRLGMAV